MGGVGSGNWRRPSRKATVEDSLTIGMASLLHHFHPVLNGTLFFEPVSDCAIPVEYYFDCSMDSAEPTLMLRYRWRDEVFQSPRIRLDKTRTNFDGWRWWFCCPECGRRVANLYLPAGWIGFACRVCHGLTYRSSQQAHAEERFLENPVVRRMFAWFTEGMAKLDRHEQPRDSAKILRFSAGPSGRLSIQN
jgi:hypothetical protein